MPADSNLPSEFLLNSPGMEWIKVGDLTYPLPLHHFLLYKRWRGFSILCQPRHPFRLCTVPHIQATIQINRYSEYCFRGPAVIGTRDYAVQELCSPLILTETGANKILDAVMRWTTNTWSSPTGRLTFPSSLIIEIELFVSDVPRTATKFEYGPFSVITTHLGRSLLLLQKRMPRCGF